MSEASDNRTVNVHGDMITENSPPPGDVWYPQDFMCLRAEAVRRLAQVITESESEVDKDTLAIIHAAMRSIVYTMAQVYPHISKAHKEAQVEVEAIDAVKH